MHFQERLLDFLFGLFLNTVAFIFPFYLVHFGAVSANVLLFESLDNAKTWPNLTSRHDGK